MKNYFIFIILFVGCVTSWVIYQDNAGPSKEDCEFVIPEGYALEYNEVSKEYAISHLARGDSKEYLKYYITMGPTFMYPSITAPTSYKDSCMAKKLLIKYFETKANKAENFKPIK